MLKKYICENCRHIFQDEMRFVNPDCPQCGCMETEEIERIVENLTEYEASQELDQ